MDSYHTCGEGGECHKITLSTKDEAASNTDAGSSQYVCTAWRETIAKSLVEERLCRQAWWTGINSWEAGVIQGKAERWRLSATQGMTEASGTIVLHSAFSEGN